MFTNLAIPGYSFARHYGSVSSTMDVAREVLAEQRLSDGWCGLVTADDQTAGRGRQGRTWLSSGAAFTGTFIFCTDKPLGAVSGYSLGVGLSVMSALKPSGYDFSLKWPNDLVVVRGDSLRKLGGILIEVEEHHDHRVLLVGLGINVSKPPQELGRTAISLEELGGSAPTSKTLVQALALELRKGHDEFFSGGGFSPMRTRWEERSCFRPGKTELKVEVGDSTISGIYTGVSLLGALCLLEDGIERTIHSGHILEIIW